MFFRVTRFPALIRLGILLTFFGPGKYSDASPVVTISTDKSVYFTEGGSLALICELNQDVGSSSVWFKKDGLNWIWIRNSPTCEFHKAVQWDPYTYNITCNHSRRYILVIHGVNANDHKTTWMCEITSYNDGPCLGANNPCISKGLIVFRRGDSGQPLSDSVTVVDGASKVFTCATSPNGSRPNAVFLWYRRKENQTPTLIEDQSNFSTPDPIPVPEQAETDLMISYNTLTLTFEKSFQKTNIFCAAQDKTNTGNYVESKEVQIKIVYPPVIILLPNSSVYTLREGSPNFRLTCYITDDNSGQQPDEFIWLYNGKVIHGQTSSSYIIQNVQRSDAGQYQCKASNSYGTGTSEMLKLNVQYGAKITDLSMVNSNIVEENGTATLSCFVDSNPVSDITWAKEGSEGPLKTDFSVLQSYLFLNYAQCLDTSNYTCKASNGLGIPVERRIPLHVTCHPRTDFRFPPVTKVYSKRRGDAVLRYTVISYPDPTFVWTFIGNGSENRVLPDSSIQNDDGRQSALTFINLDVEDFGFYSVTAENEFLPSATEIFELIVAAENSAHHYTEMRLLFVGLGTIVVVFIIVAIAVFLIKRLWCPRGTSRKQGKKPSQSNPPCTEMNQVNTNPVQGIEVTGEHEDLQVYKTDDNPYSEIYDEIEDYSASENIRQLSLQELPKGDTYEQLHMNANSEGENYSSVKPKKHFRGVNRFFRRRKGQKMNISPITRQTLEN